MAYQSPHPPPRGLGYLLHDLLSPVHTCQIGTGVSTRMFTLASYACLVRVTSNTFSSAIWNIGHYDWLNSCSYACAYFTPVPIGEIRISSTRKMFFLYLYAYFTSVHTSIFLCLCLRLRLSLSHKCEPSVCQNPSSLPLVPFSLL